MGHACLLVLGAGTPPPAEWDLLEDWVREPIDHEEIDNRTARLRRRLVEHQPVWLDDDGLLHRGPAWVAIPPLEARLLEPLLAQIDRVVPRADVEAALLDGDDGDVRLIDATLHRLRPRIRPLGVTIHTLRGTGLLLEAGALPD